MRKVLALPRQQFRLLNGKREMLSCTMLLSNLVHYIERQSLFWYKHVFPVPLNGPRLCLNRMEIERIRSGRTQELDSAFSGL